LNKEFSFSTSKNKSDLQKVLKVQFTTPLELGLNLILQKETHNIEGKKIENGARNFN